MSETTQTPKTIVGPGNVVHTEFSSNDPDGTIEFLKTVFGWEFEDMGGEESGPYHTFGDMELGIGGAVRPLMPEEPAPSSTPYVGVEDLDGTIEAATNAGATVMVPKTPVPGHGYFAWFQAPGGIIVAAWQSDPSASA